MPILVLSSDSGEKWNKVQTQLASWSKNREQVRIEKSTHYLHWSNFDQVLEHIESFVEEGDKYENRNRKIIFTGNESG